MEKMAGISATLEDYLEAIFHLISHDQEPRSRDIAAHLNVHKSTVTAALKSLAEMGLVHYAPYEVVTLSKDGEKIARDVTKRHEALRSFFVDILRVEPDVAEKAACGMEHALPKEIVGRMAGFAKFILKCPRGGKDWIDSWQSLDDGFGESPDCADCMEKCLSDYRHRPDQDGLGHQESCKTVSGRFMVAAK